MIVEHLEVLVRKLSLLGERKRIAFAAWACEPLLREFGAFLARFVGKVRVDRLFAAVDECWKSALSSDPVNVACIAEAKEICETGWWAQADLGSDEEDLISDQALETLAAVRDMCDVALSGSSEAAVSAAEHALNRVDFEVQMSEALPAGVLHERVRAEMRRQQDLVEALGAGASIDASIRKPRPKNPNPE